MIYLTGRNPGVGLSEVYVHIIWCEYEFLSSARIRHLIHGEKVEIVFGNMQHILEASIGEFNPSFAGDFDRRFVPHQNRSTFACIQRECTTFEASM
jgi:hypothetical protein